MTHIAAIRAFALPALLFAAAAGAAAAPELTVDETPAAPGEWGLRPADGAVSETNPPGFSWRPQRLAASYELQVARDADFRSGLYTARGVAYNVHCPPRTFEPGTWRWRFRYADKAGRSSAWSKVRTFGITAESIEFAMPTRAELLGRIPKTHPRLFVRPEQLAHLRKLADGELRSIRDALVAECEKLLKKPPPTAEPPKYPPGTTTKSEAWREIWWGNRVYTIKLLNGAATLGFTRLLTGNEAYGRLARKLLLAAAEWDPKGATGYRYNDEAGMPYNYYFSRTYTFIHDLLSEVERARCREVMAVRGAEMYRHLAPRHLWQPYGSHANRAWHFLGEIGVAFLDEIPDAGEWVWFAMNVFYNVYPVWSDADGGWHEGVSYWSSYIARFTWWADVMRAAMGIDAYRKPYFSRIGTYAMYLQPPGTVGGGFGDLCAKRTSAHNRGLLTTLAAQARNGHWQWYVNAHGGPATGSDYVAFVRGALPKVEARPPDDLPGGRCFRGTGLAMLNTDLTSAGDNVEVLFKSSPFGTQSHGYESNNSFLLYAFGERLLIRTGRRDIYGSDHHRNWMWQTKSTNCITAGGVGQVGHSAAARGEILGFHSSREIDYVAGEAAGAYRDGALKRFTRHVVFVKPDRVVIFDRLEAAKPTTFEWWLHAPTEMKLAGQDDIRVANGKAAARVRFLAPAGLKLSQTSKFDPPPRARIKLTEWHLTAATAAPARTAAFVTVLRPHRAGAEPPAAATFHEVPGGYALEAARAEGKAIVLLRTTDRGELSFGPAAADADVAVFLLDGKGKPTYRLQVRGRDVTAGPGPK